MLVGSIAALKTARFRSAVVCLALCGISAAGLLLRLHQLEVKGLYDEAASWTFARLDWEPFWRVMWKYEGNMVFYYGLLRGWIYLGDSEIVLRSLSVIFGAAAPLALYGLGNRLFGKPTGLIAAGLLAVHALHIEYSQDARSYSLLVFLIIVSCYCFVRAVEEPRRKRFWAAYLIVSSLAFYSHIFAALVLGAQWLSLGLNGIRRIGSTTVAAVSAVLVVLGLPGLIFVTGHDQGQIQWMKPLSWDLIQDVARAFTGDGGIVLIGLYTALAVAAIDNSNWPLRLTLSWLLSHIVLMLCVSILKPLLTYRLILMCVPALALLAARGIVQLSGISVLWRCGAASVLALVVLLSLHGDVRYFGYARASGVNFRPMTRYILEHASANDGIFFFTAATHMSFQYYADRDRQHEAAKRAVPTILFPSFGATPTGAQPTPTKAEVKAAVQNYRRVWLVLNNSSIGLIESRRSAARMIRSAFEAEFLMQEEKLFSGSPNLTVALYARRSVPIEQAYNSRGGAQHCRDDCYGWAGRGWKTGRDWWRGAACYSSLS